MEVSIGKVHAVLIHDGWLYGAISERGELLIKSRTEEFKLPVGDIRFMEISGEGLWMTGDGFVSVFDDLPRSPNARARLFCGGIGRVQAVHVWEDRVYLTANGMILVYDMGGELLRTIGMAPPPPGSEAFHDELRALGYVQ